MNLIPLLALAGLGAWALTRKVGPMSPPLPPGAAPSAPSSSWVPVSVGAEATREREDGITAVVARAGKTGAQLLIAFPIRRASALGSPALGPDEALAYGVAQRIAQEGSGRAYYVRTTSYGRLTGGKPAELAAPVSDLPAVGSDYRITNAQIASIQELEDLSAPEPERKTAIEEPPPPLPPPPPPVEEPPPPPVEKPTPVECSKKFFPARIVGGARDPSRIRLIVIHSTEGSTAAGAASWFQNEKAGGSTQIVVGNDGCFRSVDDLRMPAGAQGANEDGLHIEIAGFAKWSRDQWFSKAEKALENAASVIGQWSAKYGIPLEYLEGDALRDKSNRGVTTHVAVVKAFKKGDHWDPGPGFPLDHVLERAKLYT